MKQILIAYIVAVFLNRMTNWMFWWSANPKRPLAYYREHGPMLIATLLFHVPGFILWYEGVSLPVINTALAGILAGVDTIPGVDLSGIVLPVAVTPMVTLCYGWPIDSFISRIGMKLGSRFALFGGGAKATP